MVPAHLRYNTDHEWLAVTDGTVTVGMTQYAVDALGDIVYAQTAECGARLLAGESCGVVESNKAVSDVLEHNRSAIGTLVERSSRTLKLLHLPHRHTAEAVRDALVAAIATVPPSFADH